MSCGQVKNSLIVYFSLTRTSYTVFGNRTSKNFDVLARGTSENLLIFFTPDVPIKNFLMHMHVPIKKDFNLGSVFSLPYTSPRKYFSQFTHPINYEV